jgi:hypothetical protein
MQELADIETKTEPENIYLVVDAMIGQDAVKVSRGFHDTLGLTGVILTKLDGDARGSAALSVKEVTGAAVRFAGVGEGTEKFEEFRPEGMASRVLPADVNLDDRELVKIEAMISSFTTFERRDPNSLIREPGRVTRIAKGSGTHAGEAAGHAREAAHAAPRRRKTPRKRSESARRKRGRRTAAREMHSASDGTAEFSQPYRMKLFSFSRSTLVFALSSFALAAVGCSSSTSGTPTGSSGTSGATTTPASADVCASRCEAKFTTCGGDAASAKSNCASQVCNASPTVDQLTCLEEKSCDAIAGASSFTSLCPASSTGTGTGDGGGTTTPTGVTCGSATCSASQYCALTYDSSARTWSPGSCKTTPTACASKGPADLCKCMQDNTGCPTSGIVSTKCSQNNGGLSFGCK